MSEKPESDEFEDEDADDIAPGGDEVDVDHIMRDVDSQRRRAPKNSGEPAWRRLERVMEERRTAELMSDFDDYEIGDAKDADVDASASAHEAGPDEEDEKAAKAPPRRKKAR